MRLDHFQPLAAIALSVWTLLSSPCAAHHQRNNLNTSGVPIPNLTHGQLKIMSGYRAAVLDLADRQVNLDVRTRTLQNFVNLQFAYCLWGIVPGSLSNEDNPFNECSHAYLAASHALLDELRKAPVSSDPANALAQRIERDMLLNASALQMCRNSYQPFNTAQIIMPELAGFVFNPLLTLLGAFLVISTCVLGGIRHAGPKAGAGRTAAC